MSPERLVAGPASVMGNGVVTAVRRRRDVWHVEFMSEPRTSPEPLWFYVRCTGAGGRSIRFHWLNAQSCLGMGNPAQWDGVQPVVRIDGGPWLRVGGIGVAGKALDGRVLTFDTGAGCQEAEAAFCYPYGPSHLDRTLASCGKVWHRHDIGLSGAGRPLPRLQARTPRRGRPAAAAYITARQHAGETPGSWVLDGLLRAVAEADAQAPLRQVEWWVTPFVDLDGAVEGNYGKDALPWDFNRAWARMPMRPEVLTIQRDMRRFARRASRRIVVDLHGPGAAEHGLYQFVCRDEGPPEQREAQLSFSPYLAAEFPDVDGEQLVRVPRYPSRWNALETITSWVWHGLDNTVGVSIETAYQSLDGRNWLDPEGYRAVGRRIARAVAGWLLRP